MAIEKIVPFFDGEGEKIYFIVEIFRYARRWHILIISRFEETKGARYNLAPAIVWPVLSFLLKLSFSEAL